MDKKARLLILIPPKVAQVASLLSQVKQHFRHSFCAELLNERMVTPLLISQIVA
jgi:hypothetical protein